LQSTSGYLVLIVENARHEAVTPFCTGGQFLAGAREGTVSTVVYGPVGRLAQALRVENPAIASLRSRL